MTDDVRSDVTRYVENHPEADRWEVLGQLGLGPDHQDLVDDVLDEHRDDQDDAGVDEPETDDDAEDDLEINYNETCANPYCHEPRVNPHPDSLCRKHHPGDPSGVTPGQQELGDLDDNDDPDPDDPRGGEQRDAGRDHDLVAEAEAVAGDEPARRDEDVDDATEAAVEQEIARRTRDSSADDNPADADPTAAAFMGGDSAFANTDSSTTPSSSGLTSSTTDLSWARTVSALPLEQLDALSPEERRRAARKRGLEWPATSDARDRLEDTIFEVMQHEDDRVVDAPTSLGKSFTVASTRWDAHDPVTGGNPVVHLSQTRDARDEAIETADQHGGDHFVLQSRHEACPVAAGDHDPDPEDTEDDAVVITIDGQPASEWIQDMCDGRGLPFSAVHRHLEDHNDQDLELPCRHPSSDQPEDEDGVQECPAIRQWDEWRDGDHPLVIATHNFAHVPGLRTATNVVFDEEVDFTADLTTDRVRRAVGAYLREIDATVKTWEAFISLSLYDGYGDDAANERDALEDDLDAEPDRDWYFQNPDAHTLAPALARAIFHAEDRANNRRFGKTPYEPPRLDRDARDDAGWNREWVSVVLDDSNDVATVRVVPDLSQARSVIGLDAHPAQPVWQANTLPWIQPKHVLDPEERQLWRRYERGLRVVQVGTATRPLASGEYFDSRGTEAVLEHLQERYGSDFRTAITAASVEDRMETLMEHVGIRQPELMHYGEEKSRNDFATEPIGFVNGSIDPGDDYVCNLLAELDLDAEPERSDGDCDHCDGDGCHQCNGTGHKRAHGRGFTGSDADKAQAILAAVRENHTAQAAGRYARNPDDQSSTATVFVRTDAVPPGFVDVQVPGAEWVYTSDQQAVIEALRDHPGTATARELATDVDVSKRTVHRVLERLVEHGSVHAIERAGPNGATLYRDDGTPNAGVVDLTGDDGAITTPPVWDSYTWTVSIESVDTYAPHRTPGSTTTDTPDDGLYQWIDPPDDNP